MKFTFGTNAAGESCVPAACLYEPEINNYGFLAEENRTKYPGLGIAELNSGFDAIYWAKGSLSTEICEDEQGCYVHWTGEGDLPLTFVCNVPAEGNYKVTVTLYAEKDTHALVFLGRRRLAARLQLSAGETVCRRFVTNICPIIPRTYEQPMDDRTLDVTVVGAGVHFCEISAEPWQGPTLYIAGDSTVTDQSADYPYLPGSSYCGWGQMLSAYLGEHVAVSNHSHSGLTTESFRSEGHYEILRERIKDGDLCLIQFGHNDQKLMHLLAEGGYRENLIRYIDELREKHALPVLVTPLARNSWRGGDGAYNDLLEGYARVCHEVGEEKHVPVLELHEKSMAFVRAQGREAAKRFFFPSDYTHSNDYGAYLFAGYIFEELCKKEVFAQAGIYLTMGETPDAWIPPEVLPELTVPQELAHMENPADEHLFEDLERPDEVLTRAGALELIIAAMHFFPTNVYNDMFTDVIGHETYAGTVECAWQNGLIPLELIEDHTLQPMREVDGETFIYMLLNGYATRKDLPEGSDDLEKAIKLGIVTKEFDAHAVLTRGEAAEMCKKLKI
ncbi:MAG: rhamnogalacturonan acetylesterase [bacterium]|nr:rhamnogalacturonan acetylesterase [bacterium]MDY4100440.1 rhamnogalacturonan acetylesterase [Lachnospiraceae bacterium]